MVRECSIFFFIGKIFPINLWKGKQRLKESQAHQHCKHHLRTKTKRRQEYANQNTTRMLDIKSN